MLKKLRRIILGERFSGYIHRLEVFGEYTQYEIREQNGTDCYVWLHETPSKQLERTGRQISTAEYVEVIFPGFFRRPMINVLPAYAILDPYRMLGKTRVPNWESGIVPISYSEIITSLPEPKPK